MSYEQENPQMLLGMKESIQEENVFSPVSNVTPYSDITDLCRYYKPVQCV